MSRRRRESASRTPSRTLAIATWTLVLLLGAKLWQDSPWAPSFLRSKTKFSILVPHPSGALVGSEVETDAHGRAELKPPIAVPHERPRPGR